MSTAKFPDIGKVSPEFFDEVIYPHLGAKRKDVLVGPRHGVDIGIIKIGGGKIMAVTTDPFYILPLYGWEKAAWFAWHILASDVVNSGFPPSHFVIDLNLPMSMTEAEFAQMWGVVDRECKKYGVAVVTGHTARYTGTDYPMVGGATMMAVGPEDRYITPEMATPGDVVVITKGPAIEAVGIFSSLFPETIRNNLGEEVLEQGQSLFYKMSTVDDALAAASVGLRTEGVTAMHDATECGVIGALYEVAQASKVGLFVEKDEIPVQSGVPEICKLFWMDPFISISEGTLVMTVDQRKVEAVLAALNARGCDAAAIGAILPADKGMWIVEEGQKKPLEHPRVDPFWSSIKRALDESLR